MHKNFKVLPIIPLVLTASLVLSVTTAAAGKPGQNSDTKTSATVSAAPSGSGKSDDHGNQDKSITVAVQYLVDKGIIKGDGHGNYNAKASVGRGDLMIMLVRAFGLSHHKSGEEFSDVAKDTYYYDDVNTAKALGIAKGRGDGHFHAKDGVTVSEAIIFIGRAMDSDSATISPATGVNLETYTASWTKTASATRGQIAELIYYVLTGKTDGAVISTTGSQDDDEDNSTAATATGAYTLSDGSTVTLSGSALTATTANQSAVLLKSGALTLTGYTLTKSGDSTAITTSDFTGLNAGVLVSSGTLNITGSSITTAAAGANALFATGSSSKITASSLVISTTGDSSRGLDATYGGTITGANVTITTTGAHSAPLATDRGGGTITVTGGTLSAAGDGSPLIYSTGAISATNVTGTATGSQIACVEGKNSVVLSGCTMTGAGLNGVMLYQSTSGDAAVGTAAFTATGSTLKTTSTGPMFYVTNTTATATLTNTALTFSSGILANVAGNSTNSWGTPGANGGKLTLTGINQILTGNITCDSISTVALALTSSSSYTGAMNSAKTALSAAVSLDSTSTWTLTGTSYVTVLSNTLSSCTNIISGGYNLYYDASNTANSWLNSQTIALSGGGSLMPM